MADIRSTFSYDSDFSKVTADIKKLVREATAANSAFAQLNKTAASIKTNAASSFASQAGFAGFKAQIVDLTGATEGFGQALMKNKLTMREYFREAAAAYKKDSRARILAEREVRRAQSTVVGMGDVGGRRKGILLTPDTLDMKNAANRMAVLNKQYEVFNHLVNRGATELVNWGKNTQWAGRQLTVGLTVPMAIFSTQALKAFAAVDKEITRFRKVYGSDLTGTVGDATDEMIAQIRGLGSEFAKQYGIASSETMALAADLAATGLEGQKLANAVNQTTRLMVLGEVDRQEAMKATLSIQTAFNQSSRELAQSIDFLNAVENSTSASLQDLAEAIPKTGPVIQALGGDIKDLSVLMTALREGGINAAEGANAIKSGMASLISPTKQAIEVARQFGIDLQGVVDRNRGQLMPMLIDFQEQLKGLDDFGKAKIIEQIFGKYQFARISALFDNLNQQGSQTVGMIKLLNASSDELAKKSYSELKAQERAPSTRLAAAQQQLQEQLIKVGADLAETLLPIMDTALNILQKIVEGFNNLPTPIKNFAKILAGVAAVSGPVLMLAGIFGNLIGNAMKFGMTIINLFKRITGNPVQQLTILTDQELAAKIAADQLTGAYTKQKTSIDALNTSLTTYITNLRAAASVAPPGVVVPGRGRPPVRRKNGGPIMAQDGMELSGYGGGDKVPALLEPGEFVINKESTKKYRPVLRAINDGSVSKFTNGGELTGKLQGYLEPDSKVPLSRLAKEYSGDPILKRFLVDSAEMEAIAKEMGIDISSGLRKEIERFANSPLDRAHMGRFENPTWLTLADDSRVAALGKDFLFTTAAEPATFNQWINDVGGKPSKFPDIIKALKKANPNSKFTVEMLDELFRTSSPLVGNSGTQQLLAEIDAALKNPATKDDILDAFTLSGKRRSPNKVAKLLGSVVYARKTAANIAEGVAEQVTKKQIEMAVEATLPKSTFAQRRAEISPIVDEVAKIATSGEVMSQKSANRIAELSSKFSGRTVLANSVAAAWEAAKTKTGEFRSRKVLRPQKARVGSISSSVDDMFVSLFKAGVSLASKGKVKTTGMQKGGLLGGLMQILTKAEQKVLPEATELLQKGFNINTWKKNLAESSAGRTMLDKLATQTSPTDEIALYLSALRKKQTGTIHDTMLHRGTSIDMKQFESLKPGDIFEIPGTSSFSQSMGTAQTFAGMHRIGAEKRFTYGQASLMEELGMGNVGVANWGTRHPITPADEQLIMRSNRVMYARNYLRSRQTLKELKAQRKALEDSLYPSQEGTLFGKQIEPKPFEVANRDRELKELDRKIRNAEGAKFQAIDYAGRERAKSRFLQNREPLIISVKTPQGTMTLPLTDIAGDQRYIKGMGVMSEAEHLLTNSRIKVTGKSKDANGFNILEGELIGTQRFNMGGPVLKYANGGKLPGFGGGDRVPALLEPGEFVINKQATKENLPLLASINGGMGNTTGQGKFAVGGLIGNLLAKGKGALTGKLNIGDILGLAFGLPSIGNIASGDAEMFDYINLLFAATGIGKVGRMGFNAIRGTGFSGNVAKGISEGQKLGKGLAGKGLDAARVQSAIAGKASKAAGGGMAGKAASFLAGKGMLGTIAKLGLRAVPVAGTLLTIAEIGNFIRNMKVEEWVNQIRDVYGEATEMAKVYNIELKKTGQALKENEKQTRSMGMAAAITGRGQVEKDYAAAVKKDYGDAIERIKGLSTAQQKANTLTEVYTSLITQGFDQNQAKEITAEIARQAMATQEFNQAWSSTLMNIKTSEDAMKVLITSVEATIKTLGTAEEKAAAFVGTYENLLRQSADNPIQFGIQTANLMNMESLDPGALRMGIDQALGNMGYGSDSIAAAAFGKLDLATESGRKSASLFMRALAAGIDPKDLNLPPVELEAKVRINEAARQAKLDLNKQLQDYIKQQEKAMERVNKMADKRIAALNKEKEAVADAHEGRMKQLEDEAEALQDRADLINDNADEYIKLLEKQYRAEEYYNRQRQNSLDGLSALAEGDLFGFVQSQIKQASDAQQFGREEAINQIEETRDNAIKGIDAQLKANQKAADAAGEAADAQMDNIDKKIEKINTNRSKALRGLQGLIEKAQEIINMEVGEATSEDLQQLEDKAGEVAKNVPPKIQKAVEASSVDLVENFDNAIQNAAVTLANAYGLDQKAAEQLYAAIIGGFTASSGAGSNAQAVMPPGFGRGLEIKVTGIGAVNQYDETAQSGGLTKKWVDSVGAVSYFDVMNKKGKVVAKRVSTSQYVNGIPVSQIPGYNKGGMIMRFNRGAIVPGTGNRDTVPAMLTPGEFVVNKSATAANLPALQAMNAGGRIMGYNMGGMVGQLPSYSMPSGSGTSVMSVLKTSAEVNTNNINMPVNISVTSNDPQEAANLVVKEFRRVQRSMENRYRS
jgi:TP901 family phage tail tape measure protein